jgi:hypothetical protein
MRAVLRRLSRRVYGPLKRLQAKAIHKWEFVTELEAILQEQHQHLSNRGVPPARAAVAIHASLLVISRGSLQAAAAAAGQAPETVENDALAAADVAKTYGLPHSRVANTMARLVAKHQV